MPRRKTQRRKKPSSRYNKRRRARVDPTLQSSHGLLPAGKIVKMNYNEVLSYTSSTGIASSNTFAMNGIFDPNITGIGHQPLMHDQMALYYSTYQVIGAVVTATFRWKNLAAATASTRIPVLCYNIGDDDPTFTASLNVQGKLESFPQRTKVLRPADESMVTIVQKFSAKKFFTISKITGEDATKASFGANPTRLAYAHVGIQSLDNVSTSAAVLVDTRIQYIVRCTQPVELTSS